MVGGEVTRYRIDNSIVQISRLYDVFHSLQCEGGGSERRKGSEEGGTQHYLALFIALRINRYVNLHYQELKVGSTGFVFGSTLISEKLDSKKLTS